MTSKYLDQPRRSEREAALERALRAMVDNYVATYGDEGDDAPSTVKSALVALAMPVREGGA